MRIMSRLFALVGAGVLAMCSLTACGGKDEEAEKAAKLQAQKVAELKQNEPDLKLNVEIYRIGLTSYTLHVPNSEDYYEMPCYAVYFDPWQRPDSSRNDKTMMQETLLLNAVDGSIIHTDYGY